MSEVIGYEPCCQAHAEYIAKLEKISLNISILQGEIKKLRSSWKYHHKIIEVNGWEVKPVFRKYKCAITNEDGVHPAEDHITNCDEDEIIWIEDVERLRSIIPSLPDDDIAWAILTHAEIETLNKEFFHG